MDIRHDLVRAPAGVRHSEHGIAAQSGAASPGILAQIGTFSRAFLLSCATIAASSPACAGSADVEAAIRDVLPAPFRCSRATEPEFQCRYDTADSTVTLELAAGRYGPSASLTHDYDDVRRHAFFTIMRGFFITIGVPADTLDDCIERAQWEFDTRSAGGYQISCYHAEIGDRVTWEIFVMDDGVPKLARDAAR
jgi:hypothetical protein